MSPKSIEPYSALTRFDIENTYYVSRGVICSHGKFFGEAVYVPYFWEVAQHLRHDFVHASNDGKVFWQFTRVTDAMRAEFPELRTVREVGVSMQKGQVTSWALSVHSPTLPCVGTMFSR